MVKFISDMAQLGPEWQISCWYLAMLFIVVSAAKIASLRAVDGRGLAETLSFMIAPWLCISSWERRGGIVRTGIGPIVLRALLQLSLMAAVYLYVAPEIRRFPWWLQSYLVIPGFWLLLETLGGLFRILWLPSGRLVPAVNNSPWLAASLAEFWGRRWNRVIGDWLRQVVFVPRRRRPRSAMAATFLVSGVLHELLVSLPLQIVYGRNIWGWMLAYFLLQYGAIELERAVLFPFPLLRRLFLWLAVLGPAPLILNPGTLLIFHLGG